MAKTLTVDRFEIARQAAERDKREGLRGTSVSFDPATRRVLVELTNGNLFGFPVNKIDGLARATDAEIRQVTLGPGGYSVLWERLEANGHMPGILLSAVGLVDHARAIGRLGGSQTSRRKTAAARKNGAKGGRPRKEVRTG